MHSAGRSVALAVVVVGVLAASTAAHMLGLGTCKKYDGVANFDPAKFKGTWYVIKKVVTRSDCLTVNYDQQEGGQGFRMEEVRRPPYSDILPVDLSITNACDLQPQGSPAAYSSKCYNGLLPVTSSYIVADTDYNTYAVDYECHEILGLLKRQSSAILSRKPTLDDAKVEELLQMVSTKFGIPNGRMNSIDQDNCIPLNSTDFNLVIDEQGFNSALQNYEELETLAMESPDKVVELVQSQSPEP